MKKIVNTRELSVILPLIAVTGLFICPVMSVASKGMHNEVFLINIIKSADFPIIMRLVSVIAPALLLLSAFIAGKRFFAAAALLCFAGSALIPVIPSLSTPYLNFIAQASGSRTTSSTNIILWLIAAAGIAGVFCALRQNKKIRDFLNREWKRLIALASVLAAFSQLFMVGYIVRTDTKIIRYSVLSVLWESEFPPLARAMIVILIFAFIFAFAGLTRRKYSFAAVASMAGFIGSITLLITGAGVSNSFPPSTQFATGTALSLLLIFPACAAVFSLWCKSGEELGKNIFLVCACVSILSVATITIYMIISGAPAIKEIGLMEFLTGTEWVPNQNKFGIAPMILSTLYGALGAIIFGVPIGLLTAVFLAEIAPKWLCAVVRPAIELLAGIPSVIYGFFGMMVITPFLGTISGTGQGKGLAAVVIILSIMILPTVITTAETGIRAVPGSYREGSLALGATKMTTIFKTVIPAASPAIISGIILGVGRAIGETMAVIMVAGNVANMPTLFQSVRPMTAGIALEMSYAGGLHAQALFAIGLVLFVFIMLVNISFSAVSRKGGNVDE